jgi:hypothetical protein
MSADSNMSSSSSNISISSNRISHQKRHPVVHGLSKATRAQHSHAFSQ